MSQPTHRELRVAYLGPPASFSHQAAAEAFSVRERETGGQEGRGEGEGEEEGCSATATTQPKTTLHALPSFKHLFEAIQKSAITTRTQPDEGRDGGGGGGGDSSGLKKSDTIVYDYAVVPVENSTNGGVVQVLDLLIQCGLDPASCQFPDVQVVAEHYLQVHHCLYINASDVPPSPTTNQQQQKEQQEQQAQGQEQEQKNGSSSLSSTTTGIPLTDLNITTMYTHPQVWGQCNSFLSQHHLTPPNTERVDMPSTSAAAAFVAAQTTTTTTTTTTPRQAGISAAICSSLAGRQNGLALVASNIEDSPGRNTTRFLIVRNSHRTSPLPAHLARPMPVPARAPDAPISVKSLVTFTIPHSLPGSLASALAVFKEHGLNLTAITTRPSKERNWHYVFFVECQREMTVKKDGEQMRELMHDLEHVAERTCWLGSWVDRL